MSRSGVITFKGTPLTLAGNEIKPGHTAPDFKVHYFEGGLKPITLADLKGKPSIISVVPSLDTAVCAMQTKKFNDQLGALGDKINRLPRDLSGGEQQRVAIARAIVNAPPLLLADEPTGCLDSRTGRDIIDLFHQLRGGGLTVFLVTHDAAVAARADRIVHVEDGRVLDGELATVA